MHRNRKKEAARNAGLFFLLIGMILTMAIAVESASDRDYQNQDRMRDKRLNELIEEAVKKADYLKLKAHFKKWRGSSFLENG